MPGIEPRQPKPGGSSCSILSERPSPISTRQLPPSLSFFLLQQLGLFRRLSSHRLHRAQTHRPSPNSSRLAPRPLPSPSPDSSRSALPLSPFQPTRPLKSVRAPLARLQHIRALQGYVTTSTTCSFSPSRPRLSRPRLSPLAHPLKSQPPTMPSKSTDRYFGFEGACSRLPSCYYVVLTRAGTPYRLGPPLRTHHHRALPFLAFGHGRCGSRRPGYPSPVAYTWQGSAPSARRVHRESPNHHPESWAAMASGFCDREARPKCVPPPSEFRALTVSCTSHSSTGLRAVPHSSAHRYYPPSAPPSRPPEDPLPLGSRHFDLPPSPLPLVSDALEQDLDGRYLLESIVDFGRTEPFLPPRG